MASSQKPKQAPSRWGFLANAVASVESGLDRILADEEEAAKATNKPPPKPIKPQENGTTSRASTEITRSDSNSKINDRLQTRLAQAMAKKGSSRATTPVPNSEPGSLPETPALTVEDPLQPDVVDTTSTQQGLQDVEATPVNSLEAVGIPTVEDISDANSESEARQSTTSSRKSKEANKLSSLEQQRHSVDVSRTSAEPASRTSASDTPAESDATLLNMQLEHEKSLSSLQDEINGYLERIDALQRNMQMMARETIAKAKEVKSDPDSTSFDKQLADKDEKIALLLEEGTTLTKSEMQYRNTIKRLRIQVNTSTKDQDSVRQRAVKAEKSISLLEARAAKAEAEARQRSEELLTLSKSSIDVTTITKERNALQSTLADVRQQVSKANKRAEEAESKAQSDKIEIERRKNADLQDDLSSAKVERELAEDKLRREIQDLKQSLIAEKEHNRQMETEMLAEQAALESKLESFRLRAEESSSGDHGDSQAKLLRQIETLQSQYSAASQNWQGIESTLLGRITALEKERDEVVNREADLRRKLRDVTSRAKAATKELDEVQQTLHTLQDRQADESAEAQRAIKHAGQLEDELATAHKDLDDHKTRSEKEFVRRLEEEKSKWIASIPQTISRMDSPVTSVHNRKGAFFMDSLMSPTERPLSRRSSTQPFHDPYGQHARFPSRANGTIPETPSITIGDDQDDFFANVPMTPASATRTHTDSPTRHLNDVISASTAGAGPSVQLVERLSTNVRRLESEKAASKDEILRLSSQRDEARHEVVNLMREVEVKRNAGERLGNVERELGEMQAKHQATLELLGEKTEQVEELKADIADVKQMYRQLADTMGK